MVEKTMNIGIDSGQKNLVVVQLSGGNDYLNTIVQYQDGT